MKQGKVKDIKIGKYTISAKNSIFGYIFILPWILGFLMFTAYPFFYSIFLSLSSIRITTSKIEATPVGLANYIAIFTKDEKFPIALGTSLLSVVLSTPMIVVASLIIALLLNGKIKGRGIFRAIYFIPVIIISGPVINELINNQAAKIIEPTKYAIYQFFKIIGPVGTPILYVFDNLVLILWFSGVQILIFLAGIQKVDSSLYEAASIDGASPWEVFWKIIIPFIKPMALINTIYTIVELSAFPTNEVNKSITANMFEIGKVYSYSAAMSWSYFVIELALLAIAFLIFKEKRKESWGR